MKKERLHKLHEDYIAPIITTIIGGVILAIIVWVFGINPLDNTIKQQNTVIQKLENNIVSLESTTQVQNSVIQENSIKIQELNTTIQQQNIQINNIQNNISSSQNKKEVKQEGCHNTQTNTL